MKDISEIAPKKDVKNQKLINILFQKSENIYFAVLISLQARLPNKSFLLYYFERFTNIMALDWDLLPMGYTLSHILNPFPQSDSLYFFWIEKALRIISMYKFTNFFLFMIIK